MAIYDEEVVELAINRGLWETKTPETIPEGYCSEFENVIVTEQGNVAPRGSFVKGLGALSAGVLFRLFGAATPRYLAFIEHVAEGFYFLGGFGTNNPTAVNVSANTFYNFTRNAFTSATFTTINGYNWETAVMYRDRIYACESTGALGILRLTGWNFPAGAGALTETAIGVTPLRSSGMFVFKSRIFSWYENRVSFTDEAAAGGYPETWNTGSNFFDLPSDGSPTIQNMFVINNIIYIFSSDGIYTLQVYGPPSSWTVRKTNTEIITSYPTDSCLASSGVMFFCDGTSVFAFNGEKTVDIGDPVKEVLRAKEDVGVGYGIFPFESGIVLTVQQQYFVNLGAPNARYEVRSSRVLYFDGSTWSEFTYGDYPILSFCNSFVVPNIRQYGYGRANTTTYFAMTYGNTYNTLTEAVFYYDPDNYTETIQTRLTAPVKVKTLNEKNVKYGYLDLYSKITTLFKSIISQGVSSAEDTLTLVPASSPDFNYLVKFKAPGIVRRLAIRLRIVVPADGNTVGSFPFQIKKISLVMNTARKEPDGVSG